jgi:hypothetical protein
VSAAKDYRTPEAKKWPEDFIPPQTCGAIDDAQNALEHLRDTNSQLRHAALLWKRVAEDETARRRTLGTHVNFCRERLAEITRIAECSDHPVNLLVGVKACAEEGLAGPMTSSPHSLSGRAIGRASPEAQDERNTEENK